MELPAIDTTEMFDSANAIITSSSDLLMLILGILLAIIIIDIIISIFKINTENNTYDNFTDSKPSDIDTDYQ